MSDVERRARVSVVLFIKVNGACCFPQRDVQNSIELNKNPIVATKDVPESLTVISTGGQHAQEQYQKNREEPPDRIRLRHRIPQIKARLQEWTLRPLPFLHHRLVIDVSPW